jgi:hypothetical protein
MLAQAEKEACVVQCRKIVSSGFQQMLQIVLGIV